MSISPSVLNKALKPKELKIISYFEGRRYMTTSYSKRPITVKDYLNSFAKDYIRDLTYQDLEAVRCMQTVNYDEVMSHQNNNTFYIFRSDFNQSNFYRRTLLLEKNPALENHKLKVKNENMYTPFETDVWGVAIKDRNFFDYLLKCFPKFAISNYGKENNIIQNLFNRENVRVACDEYSQKYSNPWLYNKNSVWKVVSPLNYQMYDRLYYNNMLTQIITPIVSKNSNVTVDIEKNLEVEHHNLRTIDIFIKNNKNESNVSINIVDDIDEMILFDEIRAEIYDSLMPVFFPLFYYEGVDPNNLKNEEIKMADRINKERCIFC